MSPRILKIEVKPEHKLVVCFKNGEARLFDMGPYLKKGVFKELQNETYLKKVRVVEGGVQWPREQDLSVDTLYLRGTPIKTVSKKMTSRRPV